jgi:hypothetical protein
MIFQATQLPRFRDEPARTFVAEYRRNHRSGRIYWSVMDTRHGADVSCHWSVVPFDIRLAAMAALTGGDNG